MIMAYEMKRNPSFTPSPQFRKWLNRKINKRGDTGPTSALNELYNMFDLIVKLEGLNSIGTDQIDFLKKLVDNQPADVQMIESIPNLIRETEEFINGDDVARDLYEKFEERGQSKFTCIWATLEKYNLI